MPPSSLAQVAVSRAHHEAQQLHTVQYRTRNLSCICRSAGDLVRTMQSPQFRRALDVFSAALTSGRLDLRHFGLQPNVSLCLRPAATEFLSGESIHVSHCSATTHQHICVCFGSR